MFRIVWWFFTLFGIVSFTFWVGVGYVWFSDWQGVQTASKNIIHLFQASTLQMGVPTDASASAGGTTAYSAGDSSETNTDTMGAPVVTEGQKNALEAVGIPVSALPQSLTPAQRACIEQKITSERVEAITAGATPTPLEVIVAASCL